MRDGQRRVCAVNEIVGMEGDVVTMQELFGYKYESEDAMGNLIGHYTFSGIKPKFADAARQFGLEEELNKALVDE